MPPPSDRQHDGFDNAAQAPSCRVEYPTEVILMQSALRLEAMVLPGNRLEITAPELPEGARVEVIVILPATPPPPRRSMLEFLATLPPGPLLFKTPEDANRYVQEERDSW